MPAAPRPPRHGLALPTVPVAGPSRAAARTVIDLTEDDDDEIEITGGTAPVRPAAPPALPTALEAMRRRRVEDFQQRDEHAPYDVNAWRDLNR
jgi:hypothetical protein